MSTLVIAEAATLDQVLEWTTVDGHGELSPRAYRQLEIAKARTAWGQSRRRRLTLVDGMTALASAEQQDLAGVLDGRAVRVCGIGAVVADPSPRLADHRRTLIERIVAQAIDEGADMAVRFAETDEDIDDGSSFEAIRLPDLTLDVAKPARYGAPMTLVRYGEERDLPAIVAMGRRRAEPFRFHLDRDTDFLQYAITTRRLHAGLGAPLLRQLQFFIAEEGTTAAAYVVISSAGAEWTLEECGDRDPSGARVGALLQALIAREPTAQRPTIRGWLPPGFLPPQVTIAASAAATNVLRVAQLRSSGHVPRLQDHEVLYWRSDVF